MKALQIALVFSAIVAIAFAANASWGAKLSSSKLASTQNVTIYKKANQYVSSIISFPLAGQSNTKTIRYISITDRFTNSSGPYSTLWSGGPGFISAKVNVTSQFSQGINVTAQFWVDA
ncbi:uncharacterized protein LOC6732686 [Drosophila simulans]|uniref:GD24143 n=2 Tax=melanogaster subgroup TaxID=32351 RepID=B4Q8V3_DROSI|nr:uncharacterized protein LOC6732686 [Drosophila simulans]XP_033173263.1 uncharacterized protein LOC117150474 [Drosophila mauritiana]EDX05385.1 GD24143 [Drosophila simulans]KMY90839.1 uncharacterized protein Dsimw501_GD24143 [Drosophila simulans]